MKYQIISTINATGMKLSQPINFSDRCIFSCTVLQLYGNSMGKNTISLQLNVINIIII